MVKGLQFSLFSIRQMSEKIKTNEISPVDLIEFCFDRIRKFNPLLNAFITIIDEEDAYNNARIAEREIDKDARCFVNVYDAATYASLFYFLH